MAMPTVKVHVTADTQDAEQGLQRVRRETQKTDEGVGLLDGALERIRNTLRGLRGIFGSAATSVDRFGRSSREAADEVDRLGDRTNVINGRFGGSRGLTRGIQNAAFQMQDFAVQVGAGTAASIAFAQQAPQLLMSFGVLGAVIGVVVAVAVPLRTALKNMGDEAGNLTSMFGTLEPVVIALGHAMANLKDFAMGALETLINNIDRIIIIGATAATVFGVRWVAGFVAARFATMTLVGALTALRAAILRTGFGILIVGAGELVFQFSRLVQAAGGFGKAIGLLWDVAKEVFGRIKLIIDNLPVVMTAAVAGMEAAFLRGLESMLQSFQDFTNQVVTGLNNTFKLNLPYMDIEAIRGIGTGSLSRARAAAEGRSAEASSAFDATGINAPLESVQKIRDLLAGMKEDRITLPDILGVGEDDGDGKGKGGKKGKTLKDKLSDQEKMVKEHFDRIKDLTQGSLGERLGAWGSYFDNLVAMTGSNNQRLLALGKAFAAAQTLINAWQAYGEVLKDPTLPWWARVAAAGQVLAAGLGAVNAIRGVSAGGGSASAGGASAGGGGAAGGGGTQTVEKFVTFHVSGNVSADGAELVRQMNEALGEGYRLKGVMMK